MAQRKNLKKYNLIFYFNLSFMNKKLLFATMSLAALAACTNDDFDSQQQVAEGTSPIQFEVINNNEGMRASMDGNTIVWSAADGDLFTLYHGVTGFAAPGALNGYENATYTASNEEGTAVLSTPSMIKPGRAIMVWPADTTFYAAASGNLTIKIPQILEKKTEENKNGGVENYIPYVSDLITIDAYDPAPAGTKIGNQNTAGLGRKYPVYMRPMASQLILHADYAGTDNTLNTLKTGDDPIDDIALTSVDLLTTTGGGTTDFTQEIDLQFKNPASLTPAATGWPAKSVLNHNWTEVTDFDLTSAVGVDQLRTKCITGTESAKFLILPQNAITVATATDGVADAAVVVNTTYGKVIVEENGGAHGGQYTTLEIADAWYRYQAAGKTPVALETETTTKKGGTGTDANYVRYTNNIALGLAQVINAFSTNKTTKAGSYVLNEPTGAVGNRYVKVLLTHLDMTDLHIQTDKQLRDAAKVWNKMGLPGVTVYLDGDATTGEFEISQATIAKINEINKGKLFADQFHVKPCHIAAPTSEVCTRIVIKDGGNVPNLDFIVAGDTPNYADVVLKAGKNWSWTTNNVTIGTAKKAIKVGTGVQSIINEGTFASGATATIATCNAAATAWTNTPFVNAKGAEWNVTAGDLTVQFDVTNYGTVNISNGAEYHQDLANGAASTFVNEATDLPSRFGGDDTEIGLVVNKGVFAVTGTTTTKGVINNYGLIKHDHVNAKTYITQNEAGGDFHTIFTDPTNKMGMISLPWDNKDEDNISVNAALNKGFIAVTVNGEVTGALDATQLGTKVNYLIVKAGPTSIADVAAQVDYLEIDMTDDSELAWSTNQTFVGLVVLSPVNIKLGSTITVKGTGSTYLGAKMYVGGTFTNTGGWSGYYGNTTAKVPTYYITY